MGKRAAKKPKSPPLGLNTPLSDHDQKALAGFVAELARVADQAAELAEERRDILKAAAKRGFHKPTVAAMAREKRLTMKARDALNEAEHLRDVYRHALGQLADTPLGRAALAATPDKPAGRGAMAAAAASS